MDVIKVSGLNKSFKIYSDKPRTLKERLLFRKRNKYEKREVLKNINFTIHEGETVGLIGQNGCGKSTLLKLLTKILYPDSGQVQTIGRVSSLLELGAGFHPELSGRENIYANAAIFGLKKKEVDARLEDIIAFSELEEYIDNPVRTYSSGMYTRLAFSVAINVDADILLIDEILAVGDVNFQHKCYRRMRQLRDSGVTIVFVSHDAGTVKTFCSRAIWLKDGEIQEDGPATDTVDAYLAYMLDEQAQAEEKALKKAAEEEDTEEEREMPGEEAEEHVIDSNHYGSGEVVIKSAHLLDRNGRKSTELRQGELVTLEMEFVVNEPRDGYNIGMGFYTSGGSLVFGTNTQIDRLTIKKLETGSKARFKMEKFPLLEGAYKLQVAIVTANSDPLDYYRYYSDFRVLSKSNAIGHTLIEHEWEIIV